MLVQFSFKNFKSFKDESTLDLSAASIKEHPYNLIELSADNRYLKVAAIYGANASGKSNVLEAFNFMSSYVVHSLVLDGDDKDDRNIKEHLSVPTFLFSNSSKNQPSEFETFFIINNTEYQYGFILDNKKIHSEWLYSRRINGKKIDTLFERINNKFVFGDRMKKAAIFKDSVNDRTLFLTLTAKTKISISKKVLDWFKKSLVINLGNIDFENYMSHRISPELIENIAYKKKLEQFLIAIDSGITGIRVDEINGKDCKNNECTVFSIHNTDEVGKNAELPLFEESSGTLKMFYLFDFFWNIMQQGSVLFVDELNAKLHPLLVRHIINMFHDSNVNKNNAQLIYTTHDIFALTKETFRRDEVWFTEKSEKGISSLYSLVEYKLDDNIKVRNDATYYKDYMMGRYGAIPLLKEFNIMEES